MIITTEVDCKAINEELSSQNQANTEKQTNTVQIQPNKSQYNACIAKYEDSVLLNEFRKKAENAGYSADFIDSFIKHKVEQEKEKCSLPVLEREKLEIEEKKINAIKESSNQLRFTRCSTLGESVYCTSY